MDPTIIVAIVIVIIILAVLGFVQAAQRRKEMAAFAASRGLTFSSTSDYGMVDRFGDLDCLRQGDGDRYAYNIMTGDWKSRPITAFDYHYQTESTDSKGNRTTSSYRFSAVVINTSVPLKPLFIRPEGVFDKVKAFFGAEDINFESAEFSRKFYVQSPDRRWAYDVLSAQTIEFLLQMPVFRIHCAYGYVAAWRHDTFKADDFASAAEVITGILDRLPQYVIEQRLNKQ